MTSYEFLIDPAYIKAALVCASTEETRYPQAQPRSFVSHISVKLCDILLS